MAREIIILDVAKFPSGDFEVSAVFWLTAPANRIVPLVNTVKSAVAAATAPEIAALQNGTVVEVVIKSGMLSSGTGATAVKAALVTLYNAQQTALTNSAVGANFIGLAWDGTAWA